MVELILPGSVQDKNSIKLETRKRTWIPNEQKLPRSPEAMDAAAELFKNTNPRWRLRSKSSTYNCMGLVFASRRTVIEPEQFYLIVKDDEYRQRSSLVEAIPGDILVYKVEKTGDIAHVAVVLEKILKLEIADVELIVLSQFGSDGEYIHNANDLPPFFSESGVKLVGAWTEANI